MVTIIRLMVRMGYKVFYFQKSLNLWIGCNVSVKMKGLNRAFKILKGKRFDWRPVARKLTENTGTGVQGKLATLLLTREDTPGGKQAAHVLKQCLELSKLPHGVQDTFVDRAYNVGPSDFSEIGMSLLENVSRNDLASAAYKLAEDMVTKKFNYNVGAERRAMMEAMVLLGFGVKLDRNNNFAKLSDHVPADAINSFLVGMSSEDGRHWLPSQNVGGMLLQALGEYDQAHQGNAAPADQAASAGGAGSRPATNGNPSNSAPRRDRAAQARDVRPAAEGSAAPIQRREAEATEQVPQTGGRNAAQLDMSTGYLARPQGTSLGVMARPVSSVGHPAAVHDAERTKNRRGWRSPHSGVAMPQATKALIQGQSEARGDAKLDPANFATLGGPPYLAVARATGLGQLGHMVQAAAGRFPAWMRSGTAGELRPGALMVPEKSRAPSWAVPTWVQPGADDGMTKESLAQLVPIQTSPAAPGAVPATRAAPVTAERAWQSSTQDRGDSFASLPGTRAAWAGPARGMEQVFPSEDAAPADFDIMGDARRQTLDEMARLASRPPAGVTGFDSGQMPAWLSGWTGGL